MSNKAFEFLLNQAKQKKENFAKEIARLGNDKNKAIKQIGALENYLEDSRSRAHVRSSKGVYGDQIKNQLGYFEKIRQAIEQQRKILKAIETSIEQNRILFTEMAVEEKKLEKVLEARKAEASLKQNRIQQKMSDEFNTQKYSRESLD